MSRFFALLIAFSAFLLLGCDDKIIQNEDGSFEKGEGIFIINEGLYNQANSSVNFYHFGKDSLYQDIFQVANNEKTGDVLQSMQIIGEMHILL